MIKRNKIILYLFYLKSITLFSYLFISNVKADIKIIAEDGDTLLKISKRYGVTLKELMHNNNFNNASIELGGKLITIPQNDNISKYKIHKVKEGDTLYKISRDYNIDLNKIISINNLNNISLLKRNQIILLPKEEFNYKIESNSKLKFANKKVSFHQTSRAEKILDIVKIHKVTTEDIISLNKLENQTTINPNVKLKIRRNNLSRWLKYGPLTINWSDWRYFDGSYITLGKNKQNKSFFLAINCERRALNNNLKNINWASWYLPQKDFEFELVSDFCDKDFNI